MKKTLLFLSVICSLTLSAQQVQENRGWCAANDMYLEHIAANPQYAKNQEELEKFTQAFQAEYEVRKRNGVTSVVKIIPVVFHVIHIFGSENISDAQLKSQIDVLNNDFRRLNADTTDTPGPFKSLGADCEIEFRLAQKDPNGNCTSGINRVFSPMTLYARDNVKSLIYWPSNKYLNIWVVKFITNPGGAPGQVIGFSQFPGTGPATTDGVVFRHDFTGNIGTAAGSGAGRTATHEVGHWLNLRHIWGDDGGACTGSDLVNDTPNQADMTFSTCPGFPLLDACTPTGDGVLFSDYMDYTRGDCQNIFTIDQAARMNAALASSTSGRNNLWSPANITATGAMDTPQLCGTDFSVSQKLICAWTPVTFTESSWNIPPTSWQWDFENDGIVDATTQNPSHTFGAPGVYTVKLTVGDGTSTKTVSKSVTVIGNDFSTATPISESFENTGFPYSDWIVNSAAGNAINWSRVTTAAYTGNACLKLDNFSQQPGDIDDLITPAVNMSFVTAPTLKFRVAYQRKNAADTLEVLKVYTSTDCAGNWTQRYAKNFSTLPTVTGTTATAFTPSSAAQWRQDNVNINNITGQSNVRFKFEFSGFGGGNNIYIDDINITGTPNAISEEFANEFNLRVSPNPFNDQSTVSFSIRNNAAVSIGIFDLIGKEVTSLSNTAGLSAGDYSFPLSKRSFSPGLYFVKLNVNGYVVTKKIVVQ